MSVASEATGLIVVPAIDLRHGRVVRLWQGDVGALTEYDSDPRSVAVRFQSEGAERLHVVDLDAAVDGNPQFDVVASIAALRIPSGRRRHCTRVPKRYRDAGRRSVSETTAWNARGGAAGGLRNGRPGSPGPRRQEGPRHDTGWTERRHRRRDREVVWGMGLWPHTVHRCRAPAPCAAE